MQNLEFFCNIQQISMQVSRKTREVSKNVASEEALILYEFEMHENFGVFKQLRSEKSYETQKYVLSRIKALNSFWERNILDV
jgi:hypothetical protein